MAPKIVTVEDSLAQFADGKRGAMPVNQTAYELTKKTLLTYLNNPQVARKDKQELITKVNDLPKAYNDNAKAALTAVLSQIATGKSQGPAPIVEQPAQKPGEEKKQEKPSWIWKYAPYAIGFVPVIGIPLAAGYGVYANVVTPYFKNREEEKKALQPPTTAEDASARATRVMATLAMMKSSPETKLGDWSKNIDQMLAQLKMCNEFYKDNRLSGTILTLENLQKKAADKNIGKTPIGMLTATVEQKMINDALKSLLANVKVMAPTTQKEANDKMQAVFNSLSQMQKADKSRFGVWEPTVDYAVKELNGCLQGGFFQGEYKTKIEHAIKQLQALQVKMGETYTDTKTSKKVALGSMPMNALSETVERSWLALAVNDVQKTIGWASAKPVAPIGETPKEKPGAPGVTRKPALKMNLYRLDDFLTQAQKDEMKKPENALAKQFYDGFAKDLGVIGDTRNLIMQIGFVAYVNRCYKAAENIAGGKAKEKEIQEMAVWIYHRGEGAGGAIVKHALEARDADAATLKPGKNTLPWQMYVPQQGNIVLEKGKYVLKEDVAEKYIKGVQYRLNAKDSETYMLGFVTARAGKPEIKGAHNDPEGLKTLAADFDAMTMQFKTTLMTNTGLPGQAGQ